jgi:CHAD domain-containing protein
VRELDVSRRLLADLKKEEPWLSPAIERVDVRLLEVDTSRRERLAKRMATLDEEDLFERVGHVIKRAQAGRRVSLDDRARIAARIAERASEAKAAADSAGALYAAEALHDVRIKTKKLRYALEVGRAARMAGAARAASRLRGYQDLLGDLHDHQVLSEHAARLQSRLPLEDDDLGALSDLLAYLETQNRRLHAEFVSRRDALVALADQLAKSFTRATQSFRA